MNKKYIAPKVSIKRFDNVTPLMAGSKEAKGDWAVGDEEVTGQGAKSNSNLFNSGTDDDQSVWQ